MMASSSQRDMSQPLNRTIGRSRAREQSTSREEDKENKRIRLTGQDLASTAPGSNSATTKGIFAGDAIVDDEAVEIDDDGDSDGGEIEEPSPSGGGSSRALEESGIRSGQLQSKALAGHELPQSPFIPPPSSSSFIAHQPLAHSTPISAGPTAKYSLPPFFGSKAGMLPTVQEYPTASAEVDAGCSALSAMAMVAATAAAYHQQQQYFGNAIPGYGYLHQQPQSAAKATSVKGECDNSDSSAGNHSSSTSGIQSAGSNISGDGQNQCGAGSSTSSSSAFSSNSATAFLDTLYTHLQYQQQQQQQQQQSIRQEKCELKHPTPATLHQGSAGKLPASLPVPSSNINSFEPFCTVPGRLTLLSSAKKYRATVAEVQRRISPPECLNASILGGILRKAKNRDGGRVLREALTSRGIVLPSGRRKSAPTTCFTALVEDEALQLAADYDELCKSQYPVKAAAAYLLRAVQTDHEAQDARLELYYAQRFLQRMISFHQADRSPVGSDYRRWQHQQQHQQPWGGAQQEQGQVVATALETECQRGLTNFSMLTHGFGGPATGSMLETMIRCINEVQQRLANGEHAQTHGQGGQ